MLLQLRFPGRDSVMLFPHEQKPTLRASLDQHVAKCTLCRSEETSIYGTARTMRTFEPSHVTPT